MINKEIESIENQLKMYVFGTENVSYFNPLTWLQRNPAEQLKTATVVTSFSSARRKWFKYSNAYQVAVFLDSSVISSDDLNAIIEKIIDNLKPLGLSMSEKLIQERYIGLTFGMEF